MSPLSTRRELQTEYRPRVPADRVRRVRGLPGLRGLRGGEGVRRFSTADTSIVAWCPAISTFTSRRFAATCVAAAAGLALAAGTATGQTPRDSVTRADSIGRADAVVAPVVVTAGRRPTVTGGTATLEIRPDSLRIAPLPTLEQALRAMPFVLVRQNSRGEAEITLRGSDSRQAAVLVDGLPLTLGWDHRTDPSLVPLAGARRLAITRGLSTVLAGSNSLGGLIEIDVAGGDLGARAVRRLTSGIDQTGARVLGGQAGGATRLGNGTLDLRGGGGWRARDGVAKSDEIAASRGTLRTNSDLRLADAFAAGRWTAPGGATAGLTLIGYDAERGVPPEMHLEEPRWWRYPNVRRGLAVLSGATGLRATPFGFGSLSTSVGASGGTSHIEQFGDASYTDVRGEERGTEATTTARVLAEHNVGSAATLRASLSGADVRYRERVNDDPAAEYRQRLWSAGAEGSYRPGWLARTDVTAGLVWDGADTPESGGREPLGRIGAWGGRFGLTTAMSDRVQLHTAVNRRIRTPALRELYSGAIGRFVPNPALRPERLLGVEAGMTATSGPLTLQGVAFHTRLDDAVVRVTTPERLFRRENRDRLTTGGVELLANWSAANGLWIASDLLMQRSRITHQIDRVERRPEHQPSLRASAELGALLPLGVRGSLRVATTGAQYCLNPDLGVEQRLASWTQANLTAERSWQIGARSSFFSNLRTVLALDNAANALAYDQCGLPQPGRTLRLGVELF